MQTIPILATEDRPVTVLMLGKPPLATTTVVILRMGQSVLVTGKEYKRASPCPAPSEGSCHCSDLLNECDFCAVKLPTKKLLVIEKYDI